jgi:predicted RNA-binding protein YlxR (DUF448 family)
MSRRPSSERTCCGTRTSHRDEDLLRWFLGPDGTPWPDVARRAGGRGAWTLPTRAAIHQAVSHGGFARTFRSGVGRADADLLVERASERLIKWWYNRMGLANRAGALAVGQVSARESFRDGRAALLVLSSDAGSAAQQKYSLQAGRKQVPRIDVRSGATLGASLGRSFVSLAVVRKSAFAADLERVAHWIESLTDSNDMCVSSVPVVSEVASSEASPLGPERAPLSER